ncbi:MAG: hypothetical protein HKP27_10715 [Myxococcales bacterium]|nr:hypothetical protein [Myxococcales bacterium]
MSKFPCVTLAMLLAGPVALGHPSEEALTETHKRIEGSVGAMSDPDADIEQRVALDRAAIAENHRMIIAELLPLSAEEAAAFWPIYDRQLDEIRGLNDRLVKLVETFDYEKEDPEGLRAVAMIEEFLDIRRDRVALRRRFLADFQSALPPLKLLRYLQIENKLQAAIDYSLARVVPLADPPPQ